MSEMTMDAARRRVILKGHLQQYHLAKRKKKILEDRHHMLKNDLKTPYRTSTFEGTPSAQKAVGTDGSMSIVFRIAEVESRMEQQREEMAKAVLHVMDLIDLLPNNSIERTIVELRHIDCKAWDQISREVYLSRSAVFNHYNNALAQLQTDKRTEELLDKCMET